MKITAKFKKDALSIGLSSIKPDNDESEEVQQEHKSFESNSISMIHYKESFELELEGTTDEITFLRRKNPKMSSQRFRCHILIDELPEKALVEAEEELLQLNEHYTSIAQTEQKCKLLPNTEIPMTANVIRHITT